MPREQRLDLKDALHIVRIAGRDGGQIFFDPLMLARVTGQSPVDAPRVRQFLLSLGETCESCGCILHAYSVEPNSAQWIVRTAGLPLSAVMLRLGGRYSRYLHLQQVVPENTNPFARRYESKVLDPQYLPHGIRRVHHRPSLAGLSQRPAGYPFSSAQAYLGGPRSVALDLTAVHEALERRGLLGLRGYREFMELPETPYVTNMFDNGSALDHRIVGTPVFVKQTRDRAAHPRSPPTREQLIAAVERLIDRTPTSLSSGSHSEAFNRSLVAWHGLQTGTASLTEMGRWFGVGGATLRQGIRQYRPQVPELFESLALPRFDHQSGTDSGRKRAQKP